MQIFDNPILNAFVIMSLFVAGLGIALYYLKRFAEKQRTHNNLIDLKILSKQPLNQKSQLIIVEADGKRMMLGVTESNISLISELGETSNEPKLKENTAQVVPSTNPSKDSFSKLFISNLKKQISSQ